MGIRAAPDYCNSMVPGGLLVTLAIVSRYSRHDPDNLLVRNQADTLDFVDDPARHVAEELHAKGVGLRIC